MIRDSFWRLVMITQLRQVRPEELRAKLLVFRDLVNELVINDCQEKGFQKAANAAQMVLTFAKPVIEDDTEPLRRDPVAFASWKGVLFIPALDHFESALSLDIESLHIFVLGPKRGYAVETLLYNIEDVLPLDDQTMISDFARGNMQEAGACLAFERYTACGYHMARAVEDVARRYYTAVTGRPSEYMDKNGDQKYRMLGQIAEELQDTLKSGGNFGLLPLIVLTLRQFCRIYRNPLSHADPDLKELGSNDAEVAFGHAITAISTMLEDGRAGGPYFKHSCTWK